MCYAIVVHMCKKECVCCVHASYSLCPGAGRHEPQRVLMVYPHVPPHVLARGVCPACERGESVPFVTSPPAGTSQQRRSAEAHDDRANARFEEEIRLAVAAAMAIECVWNLAEYDLAR